MQRILGLTMLGIVVTGLSFGQVKKQFSVEDNTTCDKIRLRLSANSGTCFIKPSHNSEILNVFSNQDAGSYAHQFVKEIKGKLCDVKLVLEEQRTDGLSQSISYKVFGSEKPTDDKFWKMYLTDAKPYSLELNYGIGNANIDLSGLAIKTLKINTGSADVKVGYPSGLENKVDMDTFYVKVDLGSVNARNMSLTRTKCVVADVGFGNLLLDFSASPTVTNSVKGSVGAGNLVILLPADNTPVMVRIKDSWLCSVKMPENLKKVGENTFANAAYNKNARNALVFDLDVSLGNIIFKAKE